jgi:hypothetical protein
MIEIWILNISRKERLDNLWHQNLHHVKSNNYNFLCYLILYDEPDREFACQINSGIIEFCILFLKDL